MLNDSFRIPIRAFPHCLDMNDRLADNLSEKTLAIRISQLYISASRACGGRLAWSALVGRHSVPVDPSNELK